MKYFEVKNSQDLIGQIIDNIFPIYENGKISKIIGLSSKNVYMNGSNINDEEYKICINDLLLYILNFENNYNDELKQYFKKRKEDIIKKIIEIFNNKFLDFIKDTIRDYFKEHCWLKKFFISYKGIIYFKSEMKKYLINKFNDLNMDEIKKDLLVNEIISNFKLFKEKKYLVLENKLSILILNTFPSKDQNFQISLFEKAKILRLKLCHFDDYLILFYSRNAYVISLKEKEVVLIYELKNNKILDEIDCYYINEFKYYQDKEYVYDYKYCHDEEEYNYNYEFKYYQDDDEEYNEICQKLINDTGNIKKENIKSYDWTLQKNIIYKYINFKKNFKILEKDKDKIIFVNLLENRLIQIIKLHLQINNNIIINFKNQKISFKSIVDPLKYKLIFQNYINY